MSLNHPQEAAIKNVRNLRNAGTALSIRSNLNLQPRISALRRICWTHVNHVAERAVRQQGFGRDMLLRLV